MTRYLVLYRSKGSSVPVWEVLQDVEASSATTAIRQVAESTETSAGEYVAVPVRSWKPVTVTRVQTTTVRIGAAS